MIPKTFRAPRPAALLALPVAVLAACSDGTGPVAPPVVEPPATPPPSALALLQCTGTVSSGKVECADATPTASAARLRIIGGQGVNVKLTSSNPRYDGTAFTFDVTLQNLMRERIGSDGFTTEGTQVFFHSGPVVTEGTGGITVESFQGTGTFTEGLQPYYQYDGTLGPQQVSGARRWRLEMPSSVAQFSFTVLVSSRVVPTVVFDMMVSGNRDIYRMGVDGRDMVRLTTHAGDDRDATAAGGRVVFTSYRDGNGELYQVPLTGGSETRLTTTSSVNETSPALSPSGARLAYVYGGGNVLGKLYSKLLPNVSADSGLADGVLTAGFGFTGDLETSPTWASESRLAFVSTTLGSADLFELTLGGRPSRMPSQLDNADIDPSWSTWDPRLRNELVAFASNRTSGGDTEIYTLNPATGVVARATERSGSDSAPSWLPDGKIVFTCYQGSARGSRLCWVDPKAPSVVTEIPTPAAADRPSVVR